jgi:NAD(P)H-dependent FMN reductase
MNLLAFSGSLRKESYNHKLVVAASEMARSKGAHVHVVRLIDFDLPMFNEDLEADAFPQGAHELKALMRQADGMLIASPEYNGFFSGALKNAIDWASRPTPNEPRLACFQDKYVGLLATSPGPLGGLRGLPHLRTLLSGLGCWVVPAIAAMGNASALFDPTGALTGDNPLRVQAVIDQVIQGIGKTA